MCPEIVRLAGGKRDRMFVIWGIGVHGGIETCVLSISLLQSCFRGIDVAS